MDAVFGAVCGRAERNQPAESQERGIENSDQPQSRHTKISGEGVMGGWLSVRWQFLYSRISAGTMAMDEDSHFGQCIGTPLRQITQVLQNCNMKLVNFNSLNTSFSTEIMKFKLILVRIIDYKESVLMVSIYFEEVYSD